MDIEFTILIILFSLLAILAYTTSINFVSAAPEISDYFCNTSQTFCAVWFADGSSMGCEYNESTKKWDCRFITEPPKRTSDLPTELKDGIDNAINEVGPSNTNDPRDLGGLKNDDTNRGTDLSPESAQSSADGTNSSSKINKLDAFTFKQTENSTLQK